MIKKFVWKDNQLYRKREKEEDEDKYVLCDYNVLRAIEDEHLALECAGSDKTFNYMSPHYYGVTKAMCEWLSKKCRLCKKTGKTQSRAPLQPIITEYVNHQMQLSLLDLRSQPDRHIYTGKTTCWIAHFKDCKSKYSVLMAMDNNKAFTIAACIDLYIRFLGCPDIVQRDNGREFKGTCLILFRKHGIRVVNGRLRRPRTQGLAEQANGTFKNKLTKRILATGHDHWASHLTRIGDAMNRQPHHSQPTGVTLF